jgi:hypothetical protein
LGTASPQKLNRGWTIKSSRDFIFQFRQCGGNSHFGLGRFGKPGGTGPALCRDVVWRN